MKLCLIIERIAIDDIFENFTSTKNKHVKELKKNAYWFIVIKIVYIKTYDYRLFIETIFWEAFLEIEKTELVKKFVNTKKQNLKMFK